MPKPSQRTLVLAGGSVATALVLAAGAVTVASAMSLSPSSRLVDDRGIDTRTSSPTPTASASPATSPTDAPDPASTAVPSSGAAASPETDDPGDGSGKGKDCVVTVPPAGPTVIDRRGVPVSPDDAQGARDQGGRGGAGQPGGGWAGSGSSGNSGSRWSGHGGADDGSGHH